MPGPAAVALARALAANGGKIGQMADAYLSFSKYSSAAKQIGQDITSALKMVSNAWIEMQDLSFKTARTMAMSREQALRYNESLIKSTKELAAQYGITAKELTEFQKSYSEAVGRNIVLTREQMAHMSAFAKITDSATAAQLVDDFDKLGIGIEGALANVGYMQERAKAFGVNASKATKNLANNIKLASSYSFKNGVADLEKMAIKSASLRMDMNAVMSAADKFMDIEGAITTSARLQMLGGSFGAQFGNPMGAMYEAMADPDAFMKRLEKTIAGKGKYDSKTGQVTFDPITMMQMREAAKQLGMSVDQLTNPAMAKVQDDVVQKELEAAGTWGKWTKEQRQAIQNLSRTNVDQKTGKHYVTWMDKSGDIQKRNVEDLTKEELKIAQDSQLTERNMQMDVRDIKNILEMVHGRARETKSMKEGMEGVSEWWNATIVNLQDVWMKPISGIFNGFTNWLGKQYFADGGIVKPIHAEVGAVVPGNSYYGDKVPAMVNSGEMILNKGQQKSMFNLINSLAINGGMMYGMNKVGGKFGVGGIGSTMLLANMLGGGHTDISTLIEAHFIKKAIKSINPLKTSISELGKTSETATKSTSLFQSNWKELTDTLSKDWKNLSRSVSVMTRRYFTTGKLGKVTRFGGKVASGAASWGKFTLDGAKVVGEWIGKYTVKPISRGIGKGWDKLAKSQLGQKVATKIGRVQSDAIYGYKQIVKPKAGEYSKLIRNLFNDGSKAQASKAASRLQTPEIAMTGRHTGVAKTVETASKEASSITKVAGKGGKLLGTLGKVGKVVGKKLPMIGNVLAVGSAISNMASASSKYDTQIDEIERSGMSDIEKARAKDKAAKQKNASYGSSIGSAAGMAIGGTLGAALGPLGSIAGMWLGEKAGSFLGKTVGGLFGGGEEEKLRKQEEEKAKAIAGDNKDIIKILKSIDGKMPVTSRASASFGIKPMQVEELGVKALKGMGDFLSVSAGKVVSAVTGTRDNEINLNVSGTIKLEGGNKSVELDLNKLLDTPEFKRKLADIISRRLNEVSNAGKSRNETARNNTANVYNKTNVA